MELMMVNDEYFLVRFESMDDYKYAKFGGPWMMLDHYLIVKEWKPNFNPSADRTENVLVWIWFPDLPIEYYGEQYLMKIGEKVGVPIKIDDATSLTSRGRFARMCVEVDLIKPLLAKYKLRRRVYKIEYEGIHMVCFNCGVYGHNAEKCKEKQSSESLNESSSTAAQPEDQAAGSQDGGTWRQESEKETWIRPEICDSYGPWMLAPSRSRRENRSQTGKNIVASKNGNNRTLQKGRNQFVRNEEISNPFGVLSETNIWGNNGLGQEQEEAFVGAQKENTENYGPSVDTREVESSKGKKSAAQKETITGANNVRGNHVDSKGRKNNYGGIKIQEPSGNGGEGGGRNRAAEKEEYTVVRGRRNGKSVERISIPMNVDDHVWPKLGHASSSEHFQDDPGDMRLLDEQEGGFWQNAMRVDDGCDVGEASADHGVV